uniref:inositol-1,3,4-trisphosphate 5/6-kinase n=1 Tax=Plectus sambesii TaxID=2011161 RepID=A0A914WVJ2_9BILA
MNTFTFQQYTSSHPEVVVIDPFESVRKLCDRNLQYSLMRKICKAAGDSIVTPNFAVLDGCDIHENAGKLREAGIEFPIICKPLQAHGSLLAHRMMVIFCEEGLKDVQPTCVAQAFVPHNAVLHKLYVIGDRYFPMARSSLKNFSACDRETIFFDSQNISKNGCEENELTKLDEQADFGDQSPPPHRLLRSLVDEMRARTGLANFGMDLIVERSGARRCMVIDVNCFPDFSCLCCDKKISGEHCDCVESDFTAQNPPLFFTYMMEMMREEVAVDDTRQASLSPTPPGSGALSLLVHTRSGAVDFRHIFAIDSGIGSATSSESEASDSDKTRRFVSHPTDHRKESDRSVVPDWARIKQFYGIPKPVCELPPRPPRPNKRQPQGAVVKFVGTVGAKAASIVSAYIQETKNRSDTVP